jgi:hypothetical protein
MNLSNFDSQIRILHTLFQINWLNIFRYEYIYTLK